MIEALGKLPSGSGLERIKGKANYTAKGFVNLSHTPMMAEDTSYFKVFRDMLNRPKTSAPPRVIPSVKTDLSQLPDSEPVLVWFGHSSYLLRVNQVNILIDPVFSGNASPFSFMVNAFKGSNVYGVDDMPEIDILVITHDHYDHLDYKTIKLLRNKVQSVVCSIGVAPHLIYWGYPQEKITELYWGESASVSGLKFTAASARHFSGRSLVRNRSLWSSFIVQSAQHQIYIGGDSGYDSHFKTIGEQFGAFDLAILECGQYNKAWKYIHMTPEETVQASIDLNAKVLMPVHWGKFTLALHPWDEPIERAHAHAEKLQVKITSPKIGEVLQLNRYMPAEKWWRNI